MQKIATDKTDFTHHKFVRTLGWFGLEGALKTI